MAKRKIRLLVVEDSMLFREVLVKGLSADAGIEVVGTAADPFQARDRIVELQPDVMTLDVQMPKMNGIEFLKKLMPQHPMPVVVVSSISDIVFDAMNAGAVDFVAKPDRQSSDALQLFIQELTVKVKIASISNVSKWKHGYQVSKEEKEISKGIGERIIAIGASTGGTEALFEVIRQFPRGMAGTVVVQHMPPVFTRMYAERLNQSCAMEVVEAKDGEIVSPGKVIIAPGDIHVKLAKRGNDYVVKFVDMEKVNGHRPSVDVLFESVAEIAATQAVGVILTGMGGDGAKGLLKMREKGARTIGQDEASSVVYGMPKVAYDLGAVEYQMHLKDIGGQIMRLLKG